VNSVILLAGEDRTIFGQGNGGAEGASNPDLNLVANGGNERHPVLQFDDAGEVLEGAIIISAFMTFTIDTPSDRIINWHRLLVPWEEETVDGAYFGTGIGPINDQVLVQADDAEALKLPSLSFNGNTQEATLDVTSDLQFWVDNPGTNHGWAILGDPSDSDGADGWSMLGFDSTNSSPTIVVEYTYSRRR
jgi:hypothetical protein